MFSSVKVLPIQPSHNVFMELTLGIGALPPWNRLVLNMPTIAYHGIGDTHRVNGLMRSLYLQLEVKSIVVGLKAVHL